MNTRGDLRVVYLDCEELFWSRFSLLMRLISSTVRKVRCTSSVELLFGRRPEKGCVATGGRESEGPGSPEEGLDGIVTPLAFLRQAQYPAPASAMAKAEPIAIAVFRR